MNKHVLKNHSQLFSESLKEEQFFLRKVAVETLEIALKAVKPSNLIEKSVNVQQNILSIQEKQYALEDHQTIFIIGGGKAAAEMAVSLENKLKTISNIHYEGIINIPVGLEIESSLKKGKIKANHATHPIPNENGIQGVKSMMKLIEKAPSNSLIICLITGGGSALLPLPKEGLSLEDLQDVNAKLLACGASIQEINVIRKHLSAFKGGNLAKKIHDSRGAILITLIISDVIGDPLDSIASGPTVPDMSTFSDAYEILNNYNILATIPSAARQIIEKGIKGEIQENPKSNDECFQKVHNFLIGSVRMAVDGILPNLEARGFEIDFFSNAISGEARTFGKKIFEKIKKEYQVFNGNNSDKEKKIALIGTGELTVTLKGKGKGGRNQEMLLSFVKEANDLDMKRNFILMGVNLDGIEGNSEAMGAIVDNHIIKKTRLLKINPNYILDNNDSNTYFKKVSGELISGPTGCNVNDLFLCLIM